MKEEAAAGLTAFSDALKAARSELSGKQLGFAGDMVQQAADGLDSLAQALERRSPGEMLEGIRAFGRQNPVGFIAGSVLAGFALGRLAAVIPTGTGTAGGTGSAGHGTMSSGTSGGSGYASPTAGQGRFTEGAGHYAGSPTEGAER